MAFACGSASCVTGSTLQWRSSAPTGDRSRRLLASSSSQLVTLDAALLRLRIAAPGRPDRRQAQGPRAMVPLEPIILAPPEIDATTFVLGSFVTGALSFGVFRTIVYFRMQLFIASMLARHVPKGGARVVDFSIREGRNLYYYPKDTVQVVGVNPNPKVPMLETQAAYAKVPIRILPDVSRLPANSMDAVVSVHGMEDMSDEQVEAVLRDAVRVLKPGKKFIYIENVGAENPLVLAAQQSIEGIGKLVGKNYTITRNVLSFILKTKGFEVIKYQTVLGFQDPHIVGIATKKEQTTTGAGIGKDTMPKKNKKEKVPQKTVLPDPQKIEFPGQ